MDDELKDAIKKGASLKKVDQEEIEKHKEEKKKRMEELKKLAAKLEKDEEKDE